MEAPCGDDKGILLVFILFDGVFEFKRIFHSKSMVVSFPGLWFNKIRLALSEKDVNNGCKQRQYIPVVA